MNDFVKYYQDFNISPVSQDISDLDLHIRRRKRLYELLGISPKIFENSSILEVGAGSGYNSLVFLLLGSSVDIVEPNFVGINEAKKIFEKYNISLDKVNFYQKMIEEIDIVTKYDMVVAEGFLPSLKRKEQEGVVSSLKKFCKKDGYVVVTSMCEFSYFFEDLRRMLGFLLVEDIIGYDEKVERLSRAFEKHLKNLKFASRPIQDWVKDTILNPTADVEFLDMGSTIKMFKDVGGGDI